MANMNSTEIINIDNEVQSKLSRIKRFLISNSATILFIIVCAIGIKLSKLPTFFIFNELVNRITRNSFLVLALIIPVLAGMGLNFSIIIGAMAGQVAIIAVTHWGITGIKGFLLCVLLSTPIAILFGNLTGRLLNKTKGQEMIASMIVGFFANGLYQFLFLFLVGTLIPMDNPNMVLNSGIGIRNAIGLSRDGGIMYALDNLVKQPLFIALLEFSLAVMLITVCVYIIKNIKSKKLKNTKPIKKTKYVFVGVISLIVVILSTIMILVSKDLFFAGLISNKMKIFANIKILSKIRVPIITTLVVVALGLFNILIVKTKIGQDFRTVGQDKQIAKISGINVTKVRILAITISTLLAAWGQLIFLQNIGTLNTYGSHMQIGLFSIAALLIGGASVAKASVGQAILGVILLHTLFIVSPTAGKNLFGDAQIGEYFRSFVAYGVIGVSLALHAWKKRVESKNKPKA